jgi:NhaP-type Na+/H+ or K+/H+ antiporter
MNLIELTAFISIFSGVMAGSASGHGFWGIVGLCFGAIYGFALGLGIAVLLYQMDRSAWRRYCMNKNAVLSLGISFISAVTGRLLSGVSAVAVTLVIDRFL